MFQFIKSKMNNQEGKNKTTLLDSTSPPLQNAGN